MKKLIYILLSVVALSASAEELECYDTKQLFSDLRSKYKEAPILLGATSDQAKSIMSFWANTSTNSWTIIATKDSVSCVIGMGIELKLINSDVKKNQGTARAASL